MGRYKNELLIKIIESEDIVKAISNPEEDFLSHPLIDNPYGLINKNIFPRHRVTDVDSTEEVYITIKHGNYRLHNNSFKSGRIIIYVLCHTRLLPTAYLGDRIDFIINELHKIFNKSRSFGIGELKFKTMNEFEVNDKYVGSLIEYEVTDWN